MKLAPEEIKQIRLGYPRGHKAIAALLDHIQAITKERDEAVAAGVENEKVLINVLRQRDELRKMLEKGVIEMTDLRKELENHLLDPFAPKTREDDITTGAKLALRAALEKQFEIGLTSYGPVVSVSTIESLLDSLSEEPSVATTPTPDLRELAVNWLADTPHCEKVPLSMLEELLEHAYNLGRKQGLEEASKYLSKLCHWEASAAIHKLISDETDKSQK